MENVSATADIFIYNTANQGIHGRAFPSATADILPCHVNITSLPSATADIEQPKRKSPHPQISDLLQQALKPTQHTTYGRPHLLQQTFSAT